MRRSKGGILSRAVLALLVGCVVIMGGCAQQDPHQVMRRNLQAPPSGPKALAVYMPWFGTASHINVGYSSQDANVLRQQIQNARTMGISGFVVDWYGNRDPFLDKSFAVLQQVADEQHFKVGLMYDETENETGEATDDALAAFDKAYTAYIGPQAPYRGAYLTFNDRPVIFIFPKQGHTDWNRVRAHVNAWSPPPLLFYKDEAPPQFSAAFDGYYPWVHPDKQGWAADGSDWGQHYLENFYQTMQNKDAGKIMVAAAWPGFDDSRAKWSLNRYMSARCGKTFEDTLQLSHRYDDASRPAPFILIETWNDYEEGTAIEHPELSGCGGRSDAPVSLEGP
jgi:hypothetical protein